MKKASLTKVTSTSRYALSPEATPATHRSLRRR